EIMKAMWTEDEVHYAGKHYQLEGGICQPKPIQRPHIPLWIAGGGEQITLNIAAEHAAYSNFGVDLDQFKQKSQVLEKHCRNLGTDYEAITRSSNFMVICADTEAAVEEKKRWLFAHLTERVPEEKAESTMRLYDRMSGTPAQISERLSEWEKAGMTYAISYFADAAHDPSGMELFAKTVLAQLA
ncbi:MAG: LLM class flavin-dependent oxidoreductase, partial [Acidimicrobiia bacterium]